MKQWIVVKRDMLRSPNWGFKCVITSNAGSMSTWRGFHGRKSIHILSMV